MAQTESEQIARLTGWREQALSIRESSLAEVEQAVETIYRSAEKSTPNIVWCEGPAHAILLQALLPQIKQSSLWRSASFNPDRATDAVRTELDRQRVIHQIIQPNLTRVRRQWRAGELDAISNAIIESITDGNHCRPRVLPVQTFQSPRAVSRIIHTPLRDDRKFDQDEFNFSLRTRTSFNAPERQRLNSAVCAETGRLARSMELFRQAWRHYCAIPMPQEFRFTAWSIWASLYYAVAPSLTQTDSSDDAEPIAEEVFDAWTCLAHHTFAAIFQSDTCFVIRKPTVMHLNDRFELHCEDAPCIGFPDGFRAYGINGVAIPEQTMVRCLPEA